jgi:hypothetical protein
MTAAFIDQDPTTVILVPTTRVTTPAGGYTEEVGVSRDPQVFKLILLAYDQRPTLTLAGVERVIDYHILALPDAVIAVGDYWVDEAGTRWDVVGFSEGWDYETKAFASRHVPRSARP